MPCGSEGGGDEAPRLPGRKRECTVRPATKRWSALGVIMGFAVPALLLLAAPLEAGAGKSFEMLAGTVALPMAFRWLVFEDLPIMQGWELLILAAAALNALALLVLHIPRDAALRAAAPRWRSARYTAWAARGRMQRRTSAYPGSGPAPAAPALRRLGDRDARGTGAGCAPPVPPAGRKRSRRTGGNRDRDRPAGRGPWPRTTTRTNAKPPRRIRPPSREPCAVWARANPRQRRPCARTVRRAGQSSTSSPVRIVTKAMPSGSALSRISSARLLRSASVFGGGRAGFIAGERPAVI